MLTRLGYRVDDAPLSVDGDARPLCCGRTFLSAGLVEEARAEARRVLAAAAPFLARGVPIVGLEPSCLLTLRDEFLSMLPGAETERLASHAFLFEEFLAREAAAGRVCPGRSARHRARCCCTGTAIRRRSASWAAVGARWRWSRGSRSRPWSSSCCGMAGAFGYGADTYAVSMAMGELTLLPAVRDAAPDTVIAADGFSCRHQIQRRHRPPAAACRAHPAARPCRRQRQAIRVRNYAHGWDLRLAWTHPCRAG